MYKDLPTALKLAEDFGVSLPATSISREILRAAKSQGKGDLDSAVVITVLEAMANIGVKAKDRDDRLLRPLDAPLFLQQLAGDNQVLDFGGSLVDAQGANLPVEFFHRVALADAVSPRGSGRPGRLPAERFPWQRVWPWMIPW